MSDDRIHTDDLGIGAEDFPIVIELTLIELDGSGVTTLEFPLDVPGYFSPSREDLEGRDVHQTRIRTATGKEWSSHE